MSASPLSFLRSGPPPPRVVLLPDGLFFSRAVPLAAGTTPADAATQVELALEGISPFPLSQLYYGWYWVPGAPHAFVYAAYRRRFTTDQTDAWREAELVAPTSAALFGGTVQPATTALLGSEHGLTAIHWEDPRVPSRVVFRPIAPEATDEERAAAREELLRSFGGSRTVIDLLVPPAADATLNDSEFTFRSGDYVSKLAGPLAATLDVRDKGELATMRAARKRDVMLWRVVLGCAAALLLLGVGELALLGGRAWQNVRSAQVKARAPAVKQIMEAQELAVNVQDLVTRRFLPLEMVTVVLGTNAEKKPSDILITQIQSDSNDAGRGGHKLVLDVETSNPAQVPAYRAELEKLTDSVQEVAVESLGTRRGRQSFRVTVTFKRGVLKPEPA